MKQKIYGTLYDTENSILLASEEPWAVDAVVPPVFRKKFLYRTEQSRYFIWHRTHWQKARDFIEPVTIEAAMHVFHHLPVKVQDFGDAFDTAGEQVPS